MGLEKALHKHLFEEVDNSPLIVFRIFFGLLAFLESAGAIFTGWVKDTFVEPKHALTFIGFEWLQPLPGYGMYFYYAIMAVAGLMIMTGSWYKLATLIFTFMWWGCYLMQKSHYNNHYYLLILLSFFMLIVPAHRYFSGDVKRNPSLKSMTCPKWCFLIFILQVWIVFTYASIAKLYPDWLQGKPIGLWFSYKTHYPVIGPLLGKEWFKLAVVYGAILFDLLIIPMLLWKRTRLFALVLALMFNIFNSIVFQIGIFPYLMIAIMVFFFPPETIRRIFFKNKLAIGKELLFLLNARVGGKKRFITLGLALYFLFQLLLPLRHFLFEGNVHWTEEGHRMAWHMMLRSKWGSVDFTIKDPKTGEIWKVKPSEHFSVDQSTEIAKLPDMTWQCAQFLKNYYAERGKPGVEIYANSSVSLNGGPYRPLINPNVDLAKVKWEPFKHSDWLLPYDK